MVWNLEHQQWNDAQKSGNDIDGQRISDRQGQRAHATRGVSDPLWQNELRQRRSDEGKGPTAEHGPESYLPAWAGIKKLHIWSHKYQPMHITSPASDNLADMTDDIF